MLSIGRMKLIKSAKMYRPSGSIDVVNHNQKMLPQILPRIAITCGEPAGIGPEISLLAAIHNQALADIVLLGDAAQLKALAARLQLKQTVVVLPSLAQFALTEKKPQHIVVIDCPLAVPVVPGLTNPLNAPAVLQTLDLAIAAAMAGEIDAIVTAPLQKSVINESGLHFTGHTEYLAEKTTDCTCSDDVGSRIRSE
jgi:4-hydroxythreonine-4-phosphate dehydrogenase